MASISFRSPPAAAYTPLIISNILPVKAKVQPDGSQDQHQNRKAITVVLSTYRISKLVLARESAGIVAMRRGFGQGSEFNVMIDPSHTGNRVVWMPPIFAREDGTNKVAKGARRALLRRVVVVGKKPRGSLMGIRNFPIPSFSPAANILCSLASLSRVRTQPLPRLAEMLLSTLYSEPDMLVADSATAFIGTLAMEFPMPAPAGSAPKTSPVMRIPQMGGSRYRGEGYDWDEGFSNGLEKRLPTKYPTPKAKPVVTFQPQTPIQPSFKTNINFPLNPSDGHEESTHRASSLVEMFPDTPPMSKQHEERTSVPHPSTQRNSKKLTSVRELVSLDKSDSGSHPREQAGTCIKIQGKSIHLTMGNGTPTQYSVRTDYQAIPTVDIAESVPLPTITLNTLLNRRIKRNWSYRRDDVKAGWASRQFQHFIRMVVHSRCREEELYLYGITLWCLCRYSQAWYTWRAELRITAHPIK
ncbi:uncharacterized protein EV420DRAFT_1695578 [Desarmillaria tabescens]|uniref:Uncharacterized protein n=1 Tax=Armillaria tabescens TaxID=1929756 RepID=A0AA39N1M0_ARMTA|nr:uncharacterized protein EV420DRAFT_1695578 [Desarmillaria tabescens]KAK0454173.1 hypothetical protein EV420DRAFT_1695578 [Desarmillaria tabescens]